MMNPIQFYEAGKGRSGTAIFNFLKDGSSNYYPTWLTVSTREGNGSVQLTKDSTAYPYYPLKYWDYTLGGEDVTIFNGAYTGTVLLNINKGLDDVYSIRMSNYKRIVINIPDLELFFNQFPKLYSIDFNLTFYNTLPILSGDFSKIPISVERISIENLPTSGIVTLNFSNYSANSTLKYFKNTVTDSRFFLKISGNLANLPQSCNYLYLAGAAVGSTITYTSGKVWASAFDTLFLPIALTIEETDNLLIDADNSITTAIGGKTFTLQGIRTSISDVAVASLISKGFSVNCSYFIADAGITGTTQINAINYLYTELKSKSLIDKLSAVYPFVGGTENAHKRNLLDPRDAGASFRIAFNGATHTSNGITCISADTNYNASKVIPDDFSVGFYSRTNSTSSGVDINASSGNANNRLVIHGRYPDGNAYFDCFNATNERIVKNAIEDSLGLFTISRTSSTLVKAYKRGMPVGSNTNTRTNMFSGNILLGGGGGTTSTNRNFAFMFIGKGLTDADVSNLNTIIETFQSMLGRGV